MKFSRKIDEALKKAALLHDGQIRKWGGIPYITHPMAVAMTVSEYTDDEDVIVAALLHDTLEDTDYNPSQLEMEFGTKVFEIVNGVTEAKSTSKFSWDARKEGYLKQLEGGSQESLLAAAADKICNRRNFIDAFKQGGESFLAAFHASPIKKYLYHYSILEIMRKKLENQEILEEYEKLLDKMSDILIFRQLRKPEQCRLWQDDCQDLKNHIGSILEVVKTYSDSSNMERELLKCDECGQLYFFEHYDPWSDTGEEYNTYIPVESIEFADKLNEKMPIELLAFSPSIHHDLGKEPIWLGK